MSLDFANCPLGCKIPTSTPGWGPLLKESDSQHGHLTPQPCSQLETPGQTGLGSLSFNWQTQAVNSSPESPAHYTREFLVRALLYDLGYTVWFLFVWCSCPIPCLLGWNLTAPPHRVRSSTSQFPQEDVALGLKKGLEPPLWPGPALGSWKALLCFFSFSMVDLPQPPWSCYEDGDNMKYGTWTYLSSMIPAFRLFNYWLWLFKLKDYTALAQKMFVFPLKTTRLRVFLTDIFHC